MPTECSRDVFGFAPVEGRQVVAGFDGGDATSDAGALLLGATERAVGLVGRFAACFEDGRIAGLIEHTVETMVAQRVFGIALGYEEPGRSRPAAARSGPCYPRRQAPGETQELCAARREEHAQPARACARDHRPLPQDRT